MNNTRYSQVKIKWKSITRLKPYFIPYIVGVNNNTSLIHMLQNLSERNESTDKSLGSFRNLSGSIITCRVRRAINRGAKLATAFNGNYATYTSAYLYEIVYRLNGISRSDWCSQINRTSTRYRKSSRQDRFTSFTLVNYLLIASRIYSRYLYIQ